MSHSRCREPGGASRGPGVLTRLFSAPLLALALAPSGGAAAAAPEALAGFARSLAAGDYPGVTGALVSRGGGILVEAYARGYGPDRQHDIRSATKSVTAILVGELLEDGRLESLDTPLSELLPEEFGRIPLQDPRRAISVEDVLTMRTGLACDDWVPSSVGHEDKMYETPDWVAFLLRQPLSHEVGEHFSYCTGGVVALGRVIERLSGRSVPQLADERLFGPLGIEGARWAETPTGHTDTGGHLRLTLRDLHRVGQLILAGGEWEGERLIRSSWVESMTSEHTTVPGRASRYGYLWWLNRSPPEGPPYRLLFAHGNGGNFVFVVPELEVVAAFTGRNYNSPEQFLPARLLVETLIPALAE